MLPSRTRTHPPSFAPHSRRRRQLFAATRGVRRAPPRQQAFVSVIPRPPPATPIPCTAHTSVYVQFRRHFKPVYRYASSHSPVSLHHSTVAAASQTLHPPPAASSPTASVSPRGITALTTRAAAYHTAVTQGESCGGSLRCTRPHARGSHAPDNGGGCSRPAAPGTTCVSPLPRHTYAPTRGVLM